MPSPFPGMNPYLEHPDVWHGFHTKFLVHLNDAIVPAVPSGYGVDVEQSLYIDRPPDDTTKLVGYPDVYVVEERRRPKRSAAATVAIPRPARRPARRLVIRDRRGRTVVTVIELLSPSNKTGDDRIRYLDKRAEYLSGGVNLIEIDLLRAGPRMPIRGLPVCDYYVMVARTSERPRVGIWPLRLRDELPEIPIPLRGEPEPMIPLKPVLDRVYDGGGYRRSLYDSDPDPPLSAADTKWARRLIAREGA
jgi:hypothetical protein